MKNSMKALLAVFAVAIMMSCALVPVVAGNTNCVTTTDDDEIMSDVQLERKGDMVPKLISEMFSGICKQCGITLVESVNLDPITDFKHEINTVDEGTIASGKSVTLNGDYTIDEEGVIKVNNGGMLVLFPLDGENKGFSITQPSNSNNKGNPTIVMEYGSYLNIFGLTFQFLFPLKESNDTVTLLCVSEKVTKGIQLPGIPTVNFEFNHVGEFKMIPHFLNTRSGNTTFAYVLDGTMNMSGDSPCEPNIYTGETYYPWAIQGGTIEKTEHGIIIKNTKFFIHNYNEYCENYNLSSVACGKIKELVVNATPETKTPETGKTVVTTNGEFLLNMYIFFVSISVSYNNNYYSDINTRTDTSTDKILNTGLIGFKKVTTSTITDSKRTLEVNKHMSSERLVMVCEFPTIGFAYNYEKDELPEGYDFYRETFSIGLNGNLDGNLPVASNVEVCVEGFELDTKYSIDKYRGTLQITYTKIKADNIVLTSNQVGDISIQIETGTTISKDYNKNTYDHHWYAKAIGTSNTLMNVSNLLIEGNMDQMLIEFSLGGTTKTVNDGIEYSLTFAINVFVGNLGVNKKEITVDSIDVVNNIPLSKMMNCGDEWVLNKVIDEQTKQKEILTRTDMYLDDFFVDMYAEKIVVDGSNVGANVLTVGLRDLKDDDTLVGDVSITLNVPSITKVEDETIIGCTDATGYIQNPNAERQQFTLSNQPKVKFIDEDEYELVSGTAKFGSGSLPITLTVDSGAKLEANRMQFQKLRLDTNSIIVGKIVLGDEIDVFDNNGDKLVVKNINQSAYDISFDMSDLTKGRMAAHDGYYLPAQQTGIGYAMTSNDGKSGELIISGSEANVDINCRRDFYTFGFDGGKDRERHMAGDVITLPGNGHEREGYEFAGWTDGSGNVYNGLYVMPAKDTTLRPVYAFIDPTPVIKEEGDETVMYIDGGDAEIVKIPYRSDVDWIVIKSKNVIMEMPFDTFNNYYYWAMNADHDHEAEEYEYPDVYLQAIRMDDDDNLCPYDIRIINDDGETNDYYLGPCEFNITLLLQTDKNLESAKLYSADGCGLSHEIPDVVVKWVEMNTYAVTFNTNQLSTFAVEPVYKADSGSTTTYLGIAIAIAVVICLIIGLAFYWKDNKH